MRELALKSALCGVFLGAVGVAQVFAGGVSLTLERGPLAGEVSLQWLGGLQNNSVYSSTNPDGVSTSSNFLGSTGGSSWVDTPPAALTYYQVVGFACGEDPTPPGGTHFIQCTSDFACAGLTLQCPPGSACNVNCTRFRSCANALIICPEEYSCSVSCVDQQSCDSATIQCGLGDCNLDCGPNNGCTQATLACSADSCSAFCPNQFAPIPDVICGDSCMCEPCP